MGSNAWIVSCLLLNSVPHFYFIFFIFLYNMNLLKNIVLLCGQWWSIDPQPVFFDWRSIMNQTNPGLYFERVEKHLRLRETFKESSIQMWIYQFHWLLFFCDLFYRQYYWLEKNDWMTCNTVKWCKLVFDNLMCVCVCVLHSPAPVR